MKLLDFLTALPAEEKDLFLDLMEETGSMEIAIRKTMSVLADSEPELARRLEGPVRSWMNIRGPILGGNEPAFTREVVSRGAVSFETE